METNVLGAINLLDLANRVGAKILQASTSGVYGDPIVHPQPEAYWGNVNPIGRRACYDEGKRCAEALFFDHHRQYRTEIKVARIFDTYGPWMPVNDCELISTFVMQALSNSDITIRGDGRHVRSFCYITDLVDGLVSLMASPDDIVGPINLGSPEGIEVGALAQFVVDKTGTPSKIIHHSCPDDDPHQRVPDITMARQRLSWFPKVSLVDGLSELIAYFDVGSWAKAV